MLFQNDDNKMSKEELFQSWPRNAADDVFVYVKEKGTSFNGIVGHRYFRKFKWE